MRNPLEDIAAVFVASMASLFVVYMVYNIVKLIVDNI